MAFSWFSDHPEYLHHLRDFIHTNQADLSLICTYVIFGTFYAVFLMMVATAKGRRVSTFALGSVSILTLYSLLLGFIDVQWFCAEDPNLEGYTGDEGSQGQVGTRLAVTIGLRSFRVTFANANETGRNFNYNYVEEFIFKHQSLKVEALRRGLPGPIVTAAEYFSTENKTGMFAFPRTMAFLGRRVEAFLAAATTFYLMGLIASLTMPKYLVRSHLVNTLTQLGIVLHVYTQSGAGCADSNLTIYVEGRPLTFGLGRTLFLILISGAVNLGCALTILTLVKYGMASSISTFLELDYNTPWSSKCMVEDSKKRKELASQNVRSSLGRSSFIRMRNSIRFIRSSSISGKTPDDVQIIELNNTPNKNTNVDTLI